MIPILYPKTATDFTGNGIGFLKDTIKCTVTEERNGIYELDLQYPITGQWYADICEGAIIKAKANETSSLQLFRIYKLSKPIDGIVTYKAEHISYDLNSLPIAGFSIATATPAMAIDKALAESVTPHNFKAWSDIATLNSTEIKKPCSMRALLGGQTGSVLDVWGGEYEFDNFTIKLHKNRGSDNGVVIAYGKNLKDLKQESNISSCYTHIMPYAIKTIQNAEAMTEECVYLDGEKVIEIANAEVCGRTRVYLIDLSDKFAEGEEITPEALRIKSNVYAASCGFGTPKVSITISFVQLWQTEEYKNIAPLERVSICDMVTVKFVDLGVETKSKVIKTAYDSLKECYEKIELGDAKSNFADMVLKQNNEITGITETIKNGFANATAEMAEAIKAATAAITGQNGGYVVLNPSENPQEILILDTPSISTAVHVWRWNAGGLGYSNAGYNGPYTTAITMDGRIVADFIAAGTLDGALLQADSVSAAAISVEYKTAVENSIGEATQSIQQEFRAADEQLLSRITGVETEIAEVGKTIKIAGENAIKYSADGSVSPATITLTAEVSGVVTFRGWQYLYNAVWTDLSTDNPVKIAHNAACWNGSRAVIRAVTNESAVYDIITLYKVYDGEKGDKGEAGTSGADGVSVTSVTVQYAISTNHSTAPATGWTENMPNRTAGQYLWVRDVITYSTGSTDYTGARVVTGDKGDTGAQGIQGNNGVSIVSVTAYFAVSTDYITAPKTGWSAEMPQRNIDQWLWRKDLITYSDDTSQYTTPVVVTGDKGDTGIVPVYDTAPSDPEDGDCYINSATGAMYLYKQTSDTGGEWIQLYDEEITKIMQDVQERVLISNYETGIEETKNSIRTWAEENLEMKGANDSILQQMRTDIDQNAQDITLKAETLATVENQTKDISEKLAKYFIFGTDGLRIKSEQNEAQSPYSTLYDHHSMSILYNDTPISRTDSEGTEVPQLFSRDLFGIGSWQIKPNGNHLICEYVNRSYKIGEVTA